MALGPLREDVEDERRTVQHAAPERLLEVALLTRREFVIEDHQTSASRLDGVGNLGDFAAASERRGIRLGGSAGDLRDGLDAGTPRELTQLGDGSLRLGLPVHQADDHGVVTTTGALEHRLLGHRDDRWAVGQGWRPNAGRPPASCGTSSGRGSQLSAGGSLEKFTGRAGTTVEIACL